MRCGVFWRHAAGRRQVVDRPARPQELHERVRMWHDGYSKWQSRRRSWRRGQVSGPAERRAAGAVGQQQHRAGPLLLLGSGSRATAASRTPRRCRELPPSSHPAAQAWRVCSAWPACSAVLRLPAPSAPLGLSSSCPTSLRRSTPAPSRAPQGPSSPRPRPAALPASRRPIQPAAGARRPAGSPHAAKSSEPVSSARAARPAPQAYGQHSG